MAEDRPIWTDKAEMSRRLKAARMLRGGLNGRGQVSPLTTGKLAKDPVLDANGLGVNALNEIEQQIKSNLAPMHFEKIADALGLPHAWFLDADYFGAAERPANRELLEQLLPGLAEGVRALRQGEAGSESAAAGNGHQDERTGGGA